MSATGRPSTELADRLAAFDEVFGTAGAPREHAAALVAELERLGAELSANVTMTRLDPATSARA